MSYTEDPSDYEQLEAMSIRELLVNINKEDKKVPDAVEEVIPAIEGLTEQVVKHMKAGGRLFYIGAGTSGRLGIVDASECPPTFGVPHNWVIGLMAGGDAAIRKAVEFAEDDKDQAWKDLQEYNITENDVVVGIAASGKTPYVVGGIEQAGKAGNVTGCITCNPGSPLGQAAAYPVEVMTGAEFVTGSTRMKAGTAQKLVLNMISTSAMIQMGRVQGNRMVDMQLSNNKLVNRGVRMLVEELGVTSEKALNLLNEHGSVRNVLNHFRKDDQH